jgi:pimeloyl-ACP methyl ester carboxylesterase
VDGPAAGAAGDSRLGEPAPQTGFREAWFRSQDDLPLYWRDYGDPAGRELPVLCLTGLTRNAKDYHDLALRLSGRGRVLVPDYRGRGRSARDPDWRNYRPETYLADVLDLLTVAGVHRVVVVGTSMGGLLAMGLAAYRPTALAGAILNDVGPEIAGDGYKRIKDYVGTNRPVADWPAAVADMQRLFPTLALGTPEKCLRIAHATYRRGPDGLLHYDWDVALARGLSSDSARLPDLWPLFRAFGDRPVLAIRGALSDVLSQATFERMAMEKPDLMQALVPDVGHVPALDEPEAEAAIDEFLARV